MMPEMDGYQLLEYLKESPAYNPIPVVMLTARAAVEDKLQALRIGVDDYLLKPFEEEELVVRIQNLLRNAESRANLAKEREAPEVLAGTSKEDMIWLGKFEEYISQILGSDLLTVTHLADEFGMSQSTLLRQLKRLTGLSPTKYIQECRLSKARTHLEEKSYNTIAQVAYEVGFKDAKAFTRSFKQRFGKPPSDFI
ncbi:UNVERIFIED_CONTAM: hypothetical protein GTU68_061037 [Idotea baltica]|nr:hypothetical protein [Idotea baltica]